MDNFTILGSAYFNPATLDNKQLVARCVLLKYYLTLIKINEQFFTIFIHGLLPNRVQFAVHSGVWRECGNGIKVKLVYLIVQCLFFNSLWLHPRG